MSNVPASDAHRLQGVIDSTYLFAYAIFMFFRLKQHYSSWGRVAFNKNVIGEGLL
jgi:hypothetical protein